METTLTVIEAVKDDGIAIYRNKRDQVKHEFCLAYQNYFKVDRSQLEWLEAEERREHWCRARDRWIAYGTSPADWVV